MSWKLGSLDLNLSLSCIPRVLSYSFLPHYVTLFLPPASLECLLCSSRHSAAVTDNDQALEETSIGSHLSYIVTVSDGRSGDHACHGTKTGILTIFKAKGDFFPQYVHGMSLRS